MYDLNSYSIRGKIELFVLHHAPVNFSTELISKYFIHIVFFRMLEMQSAFISLYVAKFIEYSYQITVGSNSDRARLDRISFSDFGSDWRVIRSD